MNNLKTIIFISAMFFAGFTSVVSAEELTVESYCKLNLDRLLLAERSWQESGNPPARSDEQGLYRAYGTTQSGYLKFSSRERDAISAYLSQHPLLKQEIEQTSARIKALIAAREVTQ